MAFFRFRWRAGTDPAQAENPARPARAPQAQTVEEMRRSARQRLIGAALLVLAGVIGFPLLFDTQPRPIPVDIPIEIPDRNQTAALPAPAASLPPAASLAQAAPAQPRASAPAAVASTAHGLAAGEELVAGNRPAASRPTVAVAAPADSAKPDPRDPRAEQSAAAASKPAARPDDAARALALLEGRSLGPAAAADKGRFVVQVGAFADADKMREVRSRLERSGLKTYTQVIATKDGERTRVRVGPFGNRADAERAAARVKALKLSAAVLML